MSFRDLRTREGQRGFDGRRELVKGHRQYRLNCVRLPSVGPCPENPGVTGVSTTGSG